MNKWKVTALKAQASIRRLMLPTIHDALLDGEFSNRELRERLYGALISDEGASFEWFGWIEEIYAIKGVVIYNMLDGDADKMVIIQRTYTMDSSGVVSLADDKQEVIGYTPVIKDASSGGNCECNTTGTTKGGIMPNKDEDGKVSKASEKVVQLVGEIMGDDKLPSAIRNKEFLSALTETELGELAGIAVSNSANGDSNDTSTNVGADAVPGLLVTDDYVQVPRAEWYAQCTAVAEMKPAAAAWNNAQRAEKSKLIAAIDAAGASIPKKVYETWNLEALRGYHADLVDGSDSALTGAPDYSLLAQSGAGKYSREKVGGSLDHLRKDRKPVDTSADASA